MFYLYLRFTFKESEIAKETVIWDLKMMTFIDGEPLKASLFLRGPTVYISVCLSLCLCVGLSTYLSFCLSVTLCLRVCLFLSMCLVYSVGLSTHVSFCLSVTLCHFVSISISLHVLVPVSLSCASGERGIRITAFIRPHSSFRRNKNGFLALREIETITRPR